MTSWVNLLPINDYYGSYRAMEEAYKEGKRSHCSPQFPTTLRAPSSKSPHLLLSDLELRELPLAESKASLNKGGG